LAMMIRHVDDRGRVLLVVRVRRGGIGQGDHGGWLADAW
jgi:hypothetical protein